MQVIVEVEPKERPDEAISVALTIARTLRKTVVLRIGERDYDITGGDQYLMLIRQLGGGNQLDLFA